MADIEVHIDLDGRTCPVGPARSNKVRGNETVVFEYAPEWLADPNRFSIEPALALTRGGFAPPAGRAIFGSIGDSVPDAWGRRPMQRAEWRLAEREGRAVRTLAESDYLLGVADETRLGALRLRWAGEEASQAPLRGECWHRHVFPRIAAGRRQRGAVVATLRQGRRHPHPVPLRDGDDGIEGRRARQLS